MESVNKAHLAGSVWSSVVSEEEHGERLDKFIAAAFEGQALSRERIQSLIKDGLVTVQGTPILKASHRLKEGEILSLSLPEAQPIALQPEGIALDIVYEDAELLVVNKPRGMLTHPTGREQTGTLVNALLAHCGESLSGINGQIRPGIVHRLDRDTSGLLMVAKTDRAHQVLSAQLKDKSARRDYRAIVQGRFHTQSGTVNAPVGRNPKNRDKMGVIADGRNAITHWRVLETIGNKFALVELSLETGRTHQIRVHMSHIGHPLVGDPLYGSGLEKTWKLKIPGQMLQAFRLRFKHPDGQELAFEIPIEPELERIWTWLQQ